MLHVNCHEAQVRDTAFLCREQTGWLQVMAKYLLEGILVGLQSNLLFNAGPALRSDQVAQDFVQSGLENLWGQGQWSLSGQPALLPGCRQWGTVVCRIQSFTQFEPLFQLMPFCHFSSHLALPGGAGLAPCPQSSLTGRHCGAAARSTWSSPFSQGKCSSLSHLGFSPLSLLDLIGLSCVRVPKTGHYSRCGLTST